jgi:ADP-ribose pyrophosphatase YjhB (NUDIX family)
MMRMTCMRSSPGRPGVTTGAYSGEFGEYALDTVHRESREEIGQALTRVRLAGVLENIIEWNGWAHRQTKAATSPAVRNSPVASMAA